MNHCSHSWIPYYITLLIHLDNSPSAFWTALRNRHQCQKEGKTITTTITSFLFLKNLNSCLSVRSSVRSWRSRRPGSGRRAPSWELRVMERIWAVCWSYYKNTRLWLENCWLTGRCCRCVCACVFCFYLSVCESAPGMPPEFLYLTLRTSVNLCICISEQLFELTYRRNFTN